DEAFSNLFCNRQTLNSASEQRKHGVNWVWAGPFPTTRDEEMDEELHNICDEMIGMRMNSHAAAEKFAKNLMDIDPMRVKRVVERKKKVIVDYDEIHTESHGYDEDGHKTGRRTGVTFRPRHGDEIEKVEE